MFFTSNEYSATMAIEKNWNSWSRFGATSQTMFAANPIQLICNEKTSRLWDLLSNWKKNNWDLETYLEKYLNLTSHWIWHHCRYLTSSSSTSRLWDLLSLLLQSSKQVSTQETAVLALGTYTALSKFYIPSTINTCHLGRLRWDALFRSACKSTKNLKSIIEHYRFRSWISIPSSIYFHSKTWKVN